MSTKPLVVADQGLQAERTSLSWRRTVVSAVIASLFIWRGWFDSLAREKSASVADGLLGAGHSTQVIGLGICAMVACLTTITVVVCAVLRIRGLRASARVLEQTREIAVSALILRSASGAIVALAVAAICAIALGM